MFSSVTSIYGKWQSTSQINVQGLRNQWLVTFSRPVYRKILNHSYKAWITIPPWLSSVLYHRNFFFLLTLSFNHSWSWVSHTSQLDWVIIGRPPWLSVTGLIPQSSSNRTNRFLEILFEKCIQNWIYQRAWKSAEHKGRADPRRNFSDHLPSSQVNWQRYKKVRKPS